MGKHFHIYFAPKKTRDQAGSIPPFAASRTAALFKRKTQDEDQMDVMPLVEALMQAIAERQGTSDVMTHDAGEWDESKHPRSEGGQFSSAQHTAAAENHEAASMGHEQAAQASGAGPLAAMHQKAAAAHKEAAEAHSNAAKHIDAGTGLGEEFAKQAHSKTYQAAGHSQKLDGLAGGNMMGAAHAHLKKIASDPKQPVARRAEAAEKLAKLEKSANAVANSPHAKASTPADIAMKMHASGARPEDIGAATQAAVNAQPPQGGEGPAGPKPTQGPGGPAKAATHALLSSGHPFSVEELMKATGVTTRSTMMTALSDLKNPKYAGKLGALQIEKGADGMYRVTKAPEGGFKAVGAGAAAAGASGGAAPSAAGSIAQPPAEGGVADPHAVVHGSHPMSDYVPGDHVQAKVGTNKQPWKVLGHNAEGHVVLQRGDGTKHRMDPKTLASMTSKVAAPAAPAKADSEAASIAKTVAATKAGGYQPGDLDKKAGVVAALRDAGKLPPKPGPDGKPMGTHPELAKAAATAAANPRTTPARAPGSMVPAPSRENDDYGKGNLDNTPQKGQAGMKPIKGATATGQSFMQRVPISKAKNPDAGYGKGNLDGTIQNGMEGMKPISPEMKARLAKIAPKIAAQQNTPTNKNAGPTKGSTLGPDMPGKSIPPKFSSFEQMLEARGREVAETQFQQAGPKAMSYLDAAVDNGTPSDMLGNKLLKHPNIARNADQGDEALYDHADKVYAYAKKHLATLMAKK